MKSSWCFAKVNNRLAEIFFERKGKKLTFYGHCYVDESEYKTKQDKKWINSDIKKYDFIYKNKGYTDRKTGKKFDLVDLRAT